MTNPLDSHELIKRLSYDPSPINHIETKNLVYEIFTKSTGLDPEKNATEFYNWLMKHRNLNGKNTDPFHPLFARRSTTNKEFLMFITLFEKIGTLSQLYCQYCTRGPDIGNIYIKSLPINPVSKNIGGDKLRAFEEAIKSNFLIPDSPFRNKSKICILMIFVFSKKEQEKDCDNMAKAFSDGLNNSLITDDRHIDHLNIMKIKTDYDESFIVIRIQKSNLNEHHDVLQKEIIHQPIIKSPRIHLENYLKKNKKHPFRY